jgi:hypothetical protein
VAAADFNGDGIPDLVWQLPSTGAVQIWFIYGRIQRVHHAEPGTSDRKRFLVRGGRSEERQRRSEPPLAGTKQRDDAVSVYDPLQ